MKSKFEKLLKGIFLTSIASLVSSNDANAISYDLSKISKDNNDNIEQGKKNDLSQKYVLKIDLSKFNSEIVCNGKKIDFSSMTISEKIKTICEETENSIYKTSFIPEITSLTLTNQQIETIFSTFEEMKYDSFIIR